jgi:hypothetical protein
MEDINKITEKLIFLLKDKQKDNKDIKIQKAIDMTLQANYITDIFKLDISFEEKMIYMLDSYYFIAEKYKTIPKFKEGGYISPDRKSKSITIPNLGEEIIIGKPKTLE